MNQVRHIVCVLLLAAALFPARAELPVADPVNPPTNTAGRGLFVPPPESGPSTNDVPLIIAPPPVAQEARMVKLQPWPVQTNGWVTLRNADRLEGQFAGLDPAALTWQLPLVPGAVGFRREEVDFVTFPTLGQTNAKPLGASVLWLRNGDLLTGQQLQFDGQTVSMNADYFGLVKVPRAQVRAIHNGTQNRPALLDLTSWDQIRVLPGFGYDIDQRVYRELDCPEPALLEFELRAQEGRELELHWPVETPQFFNTVPRVRLLVEDNRIALMNSYQAQPDWLELPVTINGHWRIGLWFSRVQGRAALLVDGQVRKRIAFEPARPPRGRGLAFIHHIELGAEPEVRTLMLTPGPAVLDSVAVPAGQDQVTLANGDILPGKLESVTATNVVMTGSFGRLDLPAARWSAINLAGTDNPPPTNPAAVRVFLPGGVQVSGRLGELAGDQLALASDLVGPVTLERAVVRSLHFGLHLPPPTKYEYDPQSLTDALRPYAPGKMGLVSVARLSGELVSWTNDVVTWRHPAALAPLLVPQAGIAFINPAAVKNPPLPASTIELVNGDVLQAELLALDQQQLRVRTAHAGIWTVPAGYVREIHPGSSSSPSAADITRPDLQPALQRLSYRQYNWTNSLPDRVCVQWELVGPPVRWAMNATIFDPATGRNPDSRRAAWFLSLGNQVLSLFDNGAGPTYQTPSSVCLPGLARNGRARLTLLADRQAGEEFFLVNGQLVNERRNIKQPPTGNTISAIISIAQLHSVAIEEWRGSAADLSWPAKGDAVRLHDWTVLPGPIEELRNGQVLLSGGRSVPLTKVASLRFDPATRKTANAATVHVTLSPGERLSLSSPSFLAGKLDGTMPGIAPVSLPVTSVSRIQISATSPASWENLVQTKTFTERRQYCYKCHSQGSKP